MGKASSFLFRVTFRPSFLPYKHTYMRTHTHAHTQVLFTHAPYSTICCSFLLKLFKGFGSLLLISHSFSNPTHTTLDGLSIHIDDTSRTFASQVPSLLISPCFNHPPLLTLTLLFVIIIYHTHTHNPSFEYPILQTQAFLSGACSLIPQYH